MQSIITFFSLIQSGVLGILALSEKRGGDPSADYYQRLTHLFSMVQMLSFVTSDFPGNHWPPSLSPAETISSLTSYRGYRKWIAPGAQLAVVWVAVIWSSTLFLLLAWGVYCVSINTYPLLWPLRALRTMGLLSSGILFIPLLQMLLSSSCAQLQNVEACSTFGVAAQISVSAVLSVFLLALALLFRGVFYESSMVSKDLSAVPHGRAQALLLLIQVVLVVATATFQVADITLRLVILFAAGALWLGSTLYFLPYHAHDFNRYTIAGALVYLVSCCCLVVNVFDKGADAGVVFWVSAPLAVATGFALADARANAILCAHPDRITNPYEVDIRGRLMLHSAMWGHPYLRASTEAPPGSSASASASASASSAASASATAAALKSWGAAEEGKGAKAQLLAPPPQRGQGVQQHSQHYDGVGGLQTRVPPEDVRAIVALYRGALPRFAASSVFHISISRMYGELLGNRHMQMSHLLQAERCAPPLDIKSVVHRTRKALEEASKGNGNASAMSRLAFEKYCADVRRNVMRASSRQVAFWSELAEPSPDLSRLHALADDTHAAIRAAESDFAEIFRLSPHALVQLRLSAAFNLHVAGNSEKASIQLAEADRIEDARSREHRLESGSHVEILSETQLDIWGDSTAVVHISSQPRELGVIQSLNVAACRLFGQTRAQLERRSAFILLPPVLDRVLEASLRQYASNGEADFGVVDYNRVMLVTNKAGALVPVLSSIKDAPIDEGQNFIWAMRELRTDMEFVLVGADGSILAFSAGAALMLEVDAGTPATFPALGAVLPDYFTPAVQEELARQGSAGVVLTVMPAAREEEGSGGRGSEEEEEGGRLSDGEGGSDGDSLECAGSEEEGEGEEQEEGRGGRGGRRRQAPARGSAAAPPLASASAQDAVPPPPALRPAGPATPAVTAMSKLASASGAEAALSPRGLRSALKVSLGPLGASQPPQGPLGLQEPQQPPQQQQQGAPPSSAKRRARRPSGTTRFVPDTTLPPRMQVRVRLQSLRFPEGEVSILHLQRLTSLAVSRRASRVQAAGSGGSAAGSSSASGSRSASKARSKSPAAQPAQKAAEPALAGTAAGARSALAAGDEAGEGSSSSSGGQSAPPAPGSDGAAAAAAEAATGLALESYPWQQQQQELLQQQGQQLQQLQLLQQQKRQGSSRSSVGSGGEASSHASSQSRMSTLQSVSRALGRLRRITSNDNPAIMPGLLYLRVAGLLLTLLCIALAAVTYIESQDEFTSLGNQVTYSEESVLRVLDKSEAVYSFQKLVLHHRNISVVSPAQEAEFRREVTGNLTKFTYNHLALYALAQRLGLEREWTTNYITLYRFDVPPTGVQGNTEVVNQATAGIRFASIMKMLAAADAGRLGSVNNGWNSGEPLKASLGTDFMRMGNAHEVFSSTVTSGFADVLQSVAALKQSQLLVYLAMMISTSVVGLLVFFPILRHIDAVSDSIMLQFVAIPPHVRQVLLQIFAYRMRTLRKDYAGEEGEEDFSDDDDEGGMEAIAAAGMPGAPGSGGMDAAMDFMGGGGGGGGASVAASEKDFESAREADFWGKVFRGELGVPTAAAAAGDPAAGTGAPSVAAASKSAIRATAKAAAAAAKQKQFRKSSWSFLSLVGRFTSPLLLLFVLFSVVFGTFYVSANNVLELSAASVAAGQRASCTVQVMVAFHKVMLARVDPASRHLLFFYALKTLDCVKDNNALLTYGASASGLANNYAAYSGSPENGLPSALAGADTAALYGAAFGNLCEYLHNEDHHEHAGTFDVARCEAFSGGVLKLGLSALITLFYSTAYGLLDAQLRTGFTAGMGLNVSGWTAPADTFNYSAAACSAAAGCRPSAVTLFQEEPLAPSYVPSAQWSADYGSGAGAPPAGSAPYSPAAVAASPEFNFLDDSLKLYLLTATLRMKETYVDSARAQLASFLGLIGIFIPASVTLIVFYIAVWWLPNTTRENKSIMSKRAMLLYLPAPVVHNMPSLKDMIRTIIARDGDEAVSKSKINNSARVLPVRT